MKHTNTLTNVRGFTAQPNEKKPHKTYGHKVAELIFENSKGGRESTYVDPTGPAGSRLSMTMVLDGSTRTRGSSTQTCEAWHQRSLQWLVYLIQKNCCLNDS